MWPLGAAEGVVAGIGNGQYGGNNKVTAAEASLMIMKALATSRTPRTSALTGK